MARRYTKTTSDRFVKRWDSGETSEEYKKMLTLIFMYWDRFGRGPSWKTLAKAMKWYALDPHGKNPREAWRVRIMAGGRFGAVWTTEPGSLRVDPSLVSRCQEFAVKFKQKQAA